MPIVRLTGRYFELTDRLPMAARPRATAQSASVLVISVAKRIVRSAVRRNTVRRVVRESWRAALAGSPVRPASAGSISGPLASSVRQTVLQPGRAWLIRLRAHPVPKSAPLDRPGRDRPGHDRPSDDRPVPGFAAVKRLLRADADRLFAQALTSGPPRPRTVHFSPADREVPEGPVR